ncbi:hypothetical protein H2200_013338 [Cladophialophora chaetospira]|uniref:Major facilitator superfamily (MFS) profile domain-containing protein n=1 Tax=Cladophialophora chaetospira TaxID=386627 RepID=A0AA38WW42_9EURO|nr:hypothetical protein H2200_013338 [Cladophialophora chaetospira]
MHNEQPLSEKPQVQDHHSHGQHGAALTGQAHLYQEDGQGKVLEKLLLPRPTEDPRDPLTWAPWRKHMAFGSACFFVFMSNYITVSISPILITIITNFNITLNQASYLITLNLLLLGLGNLFWIPLSEKIGKRPVLIACSGLFFVSTIWAAVAKSYGSLLGARLVQGFAASVSEGLGPAIVADVYFLHERGLWVGVYLLAFTVGTSLGGIFSGLIANANANWHWVYWHQVFLTGALFVVTLLFQAETNFDRPLENESGEGLPASQLADIRTRTKSSWIKSLGVTSWYNRNLSIWWLWWRPFLTLRFPAVWYCIVTYGVCLGWCGLQITAQGALFPAVYNFSPLAVGNISCSYLVASFIGCFAGGPFTDWTVKYITKRNGGYFVPESRLWCMLPPALIAPVGLMLWGAGLQNHLPSMVPIVGTAITYGVLCAIPGIGMTYVVDSYRPVAKETMTIVTAAKNTFAFGLSFSVFPWIARDGTTKMSGYQVLIESVILLTTVPMYIYGARIRQWTNKFVL